jgi:hypothetical protein
MYNRIYIHCLFSSLRQNDYTLAKETTEVLSTTVKKIEFDVVNEKVKTTTLVDVLDIVLAGFLFFLLARQDSFQS